MDYDRETQDAANSWFRITVQLTVDVSEKNT